MLVAYKFSSNLCYSDFIVMCFILGQNSPKTHPDLLGELTAIAPPSWIKG